MLRALKFIIPGVLAIALGILGYFYYQADKAHTAEVEALELTHEEEITTLQEIVDSIGEIVEVYYLKEGVTAGAEVSLDQLEKRPIPLSLYTSEYVLVEPDLLKAFYKIGVPRDTPLTYSVIQSELLSNQDREYEVIAHMWPVTLQAGDTIDYRIVTPNGQDYIVFPKKRVYNVFENSITLILNEEEILRYHSAVNDVAYYSPTFIYAVKYVEPGYQQAATVFYPVNAYTMAQMLKDPNITDEVDVEAIVALRASFEEGAQIFLTDEELTNFATWKAQVISSIMSDVQAYRAYLKELEMEAKNAEAEVEPTDPAYDPANYTPEEDSMEG